MQVNFDNFTIMTCNVQAFYWSISMGKNWYPKLIQLCEDESLLYTMEKITSAHYLDASLNHKELQHEDLFQGTRKCLCNKQ